MKNFDMGRLPFVLETNDRTSALPHHPIALILDNLRSAYNVGNIFRLAEVCRVKQVITCGYTATPPHTKLKKTARGCDELVPCSHFSTSMEAVDALKKNGFQIVGLETFKNAAYIWDISFTFPVALVFGNEALGISQQTLSMCDVFAQLPRFGAKNSLNVSNCVAVATYTAVQQLTKQQLTKKQD